LHLKHIAHHIEHRIFHIIQLLQHLKSFIGEKRKTNQNAFEKYFQIKKIPDKTSYPDYYESKKFCLNAKLIEEKENFLNFTKLGESILKNYNPGNIEKFNEEIVEKCLTNNYFSNILIPILAKFHNNKQNELWYEQKEVFDLFKTTKILPILYDVEFLLPPKLEKIFVNPIYAKNYIIEQSINNKRPQSQSDIDDSLLKQKKIGQIAEKFVLEYERERLTKLGCPDKAKKVEQISEDWANKGYDIESFNGKESDDILPDRFIEVKGTAGRKFSIFWSENEIETAKELRGEYWIYFVSEINTETEKPPNEPERIQNPFEKIKPYENNTYDEFTKKFESLHITKNN